MRLDKFLSEAGWGTRSEVKKLIAKGAVTVNGEPKLRPEFKTDPEKDLVCIDDSPVRYAAFEYFMLNKPAGVISASKKDMRNPRELCVVDLIKDNKRGDLFPVGRLDKDTVGLLLITNDGALAHRLLSPKRHVEKTYYVEISRPIDKDIVSSLEAGVDIGDEKPTLPCRLSPAPSILTAHSPEELRDRVFHITISEGRYHQIKRMFALFGAEVLYLKRLSMGPLKLDESLPEGESRRLTPEELSELMSVEAPYKGQPEI